MNDRVQVYYRHSNDSWTVRVDGHDYETFVGKDAFKDARNMVDKLMRLIDATPSGPIARSRRLPLGAQ